MKIKITYLLYFCFLSSSLFGQVRSAFLPNIDRKFIDSLARIEQGMPTSLMIDPSLIQNRLKSIQNVNNTLFAGSYFGYGFHEDGIKSSIEMLKTLND